MSDSLEIVSQCPSCEYFKRKKGRKGKISLSNGMVTKCEKPQGPTSAIMFLMVQAGEAYCDFYKQAEGK
jgi:hypothetical protein